MPFMLLTCVLIVRFLVNKTNRCTEFWLYRYYDSTCFGQPFCPSSGVLSHTSALVHFMQLWWPLLPGAGCNCSLSAHHQEFLDVHQLWYILCNYDDRCYQEQDGTQFHPAPGNNGHQNQQTHWITILLVLHL